MNARQLLQANSLEPDSPALFISNEDALGNILDYVADAEIKLDLAALTQQELLSLLSSYGECVMLYHPESYHQERATLLRHFELLKKCGLQNDDYERLDFA